jgi:Holliday junction resolvase RusA-like endonuclease
VVANTGLTSLAALLLLSNTNRAPALDPDPTAEELLAAKAAGKTLVAYRAMQKQEPGRRTRPDPVNKTRGGEQKPRFNLPLDEERVVAPVSIVLPWSTLLTDNNRQHWVGTRMMTTKEYKLAKQRAVEAIKAQIEASNWPDLLGHEWQPLFTTPIAIKVALIEPNRSAKRDLLNYQKLICDAMSGVVYSDDSQIDDAHFMRGTPNIDRPRAEITVTPLTIGA